MKKANIRGVESQGMICAEDEIGLGKSHDGIIVIDKEVLPGTLAKDFYQIDTPDFIYEIGLTPNRMDSMSHIGVARDVCAYLSNQQQKNISCVLPEINKIQALPTEKFEIEIPNLELCPRYIGATIHQIKVGESPEWLKNSLLSIGLRPINNIVDITNFVLHEFGQPLHAFDRDKIKGNKIIIKTAEEGSKFKTLDEKERTLTASDLMICDEEKYLCIAGIFGGENSGVNEQTKSLFLESAWFSPKSIRRSSMHHQLRTDAAIRFEKSVDISQTDRAMQRAIDLILEIAGGTLSSEILDVYPTLQTQTKIDLTYQKINEIAGKNYEKNQVKRILLSLGFSILEETESGLKVLVPFAKNDIRLLVDVVEEIMRIDGLDNIPFTGKISYSIPVNKKNYQENPQTKIALQLTGKGFYEIFTNSITNSAYYKNQEELVKMMNNLSANLNTLRPSMLETGLESIAYNFNRRNFEIKFFEFGKIYQRIENTIIETEMLSFYVSGNQHENHWSNKKQPIDIFYLKGIIENIFSSMNLIFQQEDNQIIIQFQKKSIGFISKVSHEKRLQFDIKMDVFYAELNWEIIKEHLSNYHARYKEIPKFPFVERDLALIIDREVSYQEIQKTIKQLQIKTLENISIFDVFENDKLGTNKKSYAINLSFYDKEKTLMDVDVEMDVHKIMKTLESKIGATIRGL